MCYMCQRERKRQRQGEKQRHGETDREQALECRFLETDHSTLLSQPTKFYSKATDFIFQKPIFTDIQQKQTTYL